MMIQRGVSYFHLYNRFIFHETTLYKNHSYKNYYHFIKNKNNIINLKKKFVWYTMYYNKIVYKIDI